MPQFEVGELPGPGAGGEAGEPVAVEVGESQLRAGVGSFLADDDPDACRPGGQVEQAGQFSDPRAVADLPVTVIGRGPYPGGYLAGGVAYLVGHGEADRVGQPPSRFRQPGQELVRAAAGVGPDQHPPPGRLRQLCQREFRRGDVVGGGVVG